MQYLLTIYMDESAAGDATPEQRTQTMEAYNALTGQAKVPVAVLDGDAICDSRRIVEHLRWRDGGQPA